MLADSGIRPTLEPLSIGWNVTAVENLRAALVDRYTIVREIGAGELAEVCERPQRIHFE